jgi:hypothetical protein
MTYRPEGEHGGRIDAAPDAIWERFERRVAVGVRGKVAVDALILVIYDYDADR